MARHARQDGTSRNPQPRVQASHAAEPGSFKAYDAARKPSPHKPHHKGPIIMGIVLAIVVLVGVGYFVSGYLPGAFGGNQYETLEAGTEVTVTIPEGSTVKEMAATLGKSGLISNDRDFTKRVGELGVEADLKPGQYRIVAGTGVDDIIALLQAGPQAQGVTIPEGYTVSQIAQALDDYTQGRISADDFIAAASNAEAYQADFPFVEGAYNGTLEGFLFPKTYEVSDSDTADTMVRKMLSQYQQETAGLDYSYAESQGLNQYEVLVMASVIEKEAASDNRATVASVFYNRLKAGMKLQSDATVAYVVGEDPTPEDLEVESPYNTYLVDGLPAGPICSPGLESLKAACTPEDTGYLYFYFTEGDNGSMDYYFSETYDEHQDAIASDGSQPSSSSESDSK